MLYKHIVAQDCMPRNGKQLLSSLDRLLNVMMGEVGKQRPIYYVGSLNQAGRGDADAYLVGRLDALKVSYTRDPSSDFNKINIDNKIPTEVSRRFFEKEDVRHLEIDFKRKPYESEERIVIACGLGEFIEIETLGGFRQFVDLAYPLEPAAASGPPVFSTVRELYARVSQEVSDIVLPIGYEPNYGPGGGIIMNPGYLRQQLRPSADLSGKIASEGEDFLTDRTTCPEMRDFLRLYLSTGSADASGPLRSLVKSKADSFFALAPWKSPGFLEDEIKFHISKCFGKFLKEDGFTVADSFYSG